MGDVIAGRFELLEPIARGATGTVWRAWDHKYARPCAAKVLRQRDSADLLRFVREQSITATHPHLLTPNGWAAEDAHVVIAMPLATGGTVATALADFGGLGATLVAVILHQVLDGLTALHQAGWVHRDIKPENLIFTGPTTGHPQVQVADFGIALHRDDVRFTRTGLVHGTTGFLAPEVLRGEAVDPAQDVYAAGITALRMLHPEAAGAAAGTVQDITGIDPELTRLLTQMTAADPGQRPTAQQARAQIGAIPGLLDGPMLTMAGEPFEVFDHLGTAVAGAAADHGPSRITAEQPTSPEEPTQVAPAQARDADRPGAAAPRPRRPAPARRRRTRGLITAALSVLALVAGVALIAHALMDSGRPADPEPPPPGTPAEETDPGQDTGSDNPDTGNAPDDEPGSGQDPPGGLPDQPDQPCTWVQENTTTRTPDGHTLTCARQDDGTYAWQ